MGNRQRGKLGFKGHLGHPMRLPCDVGMHGSGNDRETTLFILTRVGGRRQLMASLFVIQGHDRGRRYELEDDLVIQKRPGGMLNCTARKTPIAWSTWVVRMVLSLITVRCRNICW